MKLPQLPLDKANHFVYGALIGFVASLIVPSVESIIIVATIAIVKEIFDKFSNKGTPEALDAVWTIIGGILTSC